MGFSLKPQHLRHYKDLALLLFKYGRRDLVARAGLTSCCRRSRSATQQAEARPSSSPPTSSGSARPTSSSVSFSRPALTSCRRRMRRRSRACRTAASRCRSARSRRCSPRSSAWSPRARCASTASRSPRPRCRRCTARASTTGARSCSRCSARGCASRCSPTSRRWTMSRAGLRERTDFCTRYGIDLHVRGVPQVAGARARLPPGGDAPAHHLGQPARNPGDRAAAADHRLSPPRACWRWSSSRAPRSPSSRAWSGARSAASGWSTRCSAPISSRSCATACSTPIPHPGNVFLVGERIALIDLGMVARLAPGTAASACCRCCSRSATTSPTRRAKALLAMGESPRGRRPCRLPPRGRRPARPAPRNVVPAAAGRARGADAAQGGGRQSHPPAGRARDDRQDAAQPRPDRARAGAAFRPERGDPPPRRRHHAAARSRATCRSARCSAPRSR